MTPLIQSEVLPQNYLTASSFQNTITPMTDFLLYVKGIRIHFFNSVYRKKLVTLSKVTM